MNFTPVQYLITGFKPDGTKVSQSFEKIDIADTTNAYAKALDAFAALQFGSWWMVSDWGNGKQKNLVRQKTRDGRYVVKK
jgi:hypothetical protein